MRRTRCDIIRRIRKLAVMAAERLDGRGWHRLAAGLAAGDPDGRVTAVWQLNELVRGLFRDDGVEHAREVFALIDAGSARFRRRSAAGWCAPCTGGKTRSWRSTPPAESRTRA